MYGSMNRKRKYKIGAIVIILIIALWYLGGMGNRLLLKRVVPENVDQIYVTFGAYPEYTMSESDKNALISLLQQVKIYVRVGYRHTDGYLSQMFVLHMADGTDVKIAANGEILIINGAGYISDYAICNEIDELYTSYIDTIRSTSEPLTAQAQDTRIFC